MKAIPVFSLDAVKGLIVTKFTGDKVPVKPSHRDDHYIFIFQEQGNSRLMVDFNEIILDGCTVLCLLPGQVHYGMSVNNTVAWFLAVDAEQISEKIFIANTPAKVDNAEIMKRTVSLLSDAGRIMPYQVIRSLLDACLGMFAVAYKQIEPAKASLQRSDIITRQFKTLLPESYKTMKSPAEYAARLNISTAYMNEAVKGVTGFSVSYWIQQEIIMEAKRILYYTDNGVKEIAHLVGCGRKSVFTYWPHALQTYVLALLPEQLINGMMKKIISNPRQDSGIK